MPTRRLPCARPGGNSDVTFGANQLGSQVMRINYQEQATDVEQLVSTARWSSTRALAVRPGNARDGDAPETSDGYLAWVTGVGDDAFEATGHGDLLSPFSLTGLFDDFNSSRRADGGCRGNASSLACGR